MSDRLNFSKIIPSPYAIKWESRTKPLMHSVIVRLFWQKMSMVVNGFEKMKTDSESCLAIGEIYALLTDGTTREIYGYILQD